MTTPAAIPAQVLAAIVADAADRGGVPGEVEVVSAESVRWNDGSLGCPEPGRSYTQSLVDGYRVIVRVRDVDLDYRVNGRGRFRICQQGGGPSARSFR